MKIIRLLQLSDVHWTKQFDVADDYTDIRDQMLQDLSIIVKLLVIALIKFSFAEILHSVVL